MPPRSPLAVLMSVLARPQLADVADAELLRRFVETRDEPAFAELVRRYGLLVWRVARTVVGPGPDAEDVFQATFLALARYGATVRQPDALAGWLHRTAFRAAIRTRQTTRRFVPDAAEWTVSDDPLARLTAREQLTALDEEIQALPQPLRTPLLLCSVEGLSQEEAASRLGWSPGSVKGRLERARVKLRRRLTARGFSVPAALGGLIGAVGSAAALPPELGETTLTAVRSGVVSPAVAKLVVEVIKMNGSFWLKAQLAVVVLVGGLSMVAGVGMMQAPPMPALRVVAAEPDPPAPPAAKPAGKGKVLVWHTTRFVLVTPEGKQLEELPGHPDKLIMREPVLSPDGKRAAFIVNENPPTDQDGNFRGHVFVRALDGSDPGFQVAIKAMNLAWTPDGKGLLAVEMLEAKEVKDKGMVSWLVDIATREKTRLDLSRWTHAWGMTPDGKAFLAAQYDLEAFKIHLALVSRDGKSTTKLTELRHEGPQPKLSPDGSRILFQDYDPAEQPEKDTPPLSRLFLYDLRTKTRQRLAEVPQNAWIIGYSWSPDGKQLAYTWKRVQAGVPLVENSDNMNDPKLNTETETHLMVADADGKNARTVLSAKANRASSITLGTMDWR